MSWEQGEDVWGSRASVTSSKWSADVTSVTASSTSTPNKLLEHPLEDIIDNPEYDRISDRSEIVEDEACWRNDPKAIRRRALMADDFEKEGKLETVVDSPQREQAGQPAQQ